MPDPAAAPLVPPRAWVREFFADVAIRQGIKMALAGVFGFACALWLRLPSPTWCIFTVVVLMMAQYVGAIAEKAMLRAMGTIGGAALGILLTGNFASDPGVMIVGAFLTATVGTVMFGGSWYPYAFFLGGLTTLVIVGNTMETPELAWQVGMARLLEICLGILVSTAVTSVVWPRYARVEFQQNFRATLGEAGRLAVARSRQLLDHAPRDPDLTKVELSFSTRMNTLRLLLRYGQRESEYFRAKLPIHARITGELSAIFEAAESLGQSLPEQSRYHLLIAEELRALHDEMAREFEALARATEDVKPANVALEQAERRCDERMRALREQGATREIPVQEALDFASHYSTIVDIARRLRVIRGCLHETPPTLDVMASRRPQPPAPFRITAFWMRNGIKGGLTAALALAYVNWADPPGGGVIPFAAWLLTATSRMYPGSQGDRRAFSYVLTLAIVGIPYTLLLLVLTPFLAHFLWMNVFLALGLFGLGFTLAKQGGISLYGQCGMLFFVGAVGLNAQKPVPFQAIVDVYFGVVLALLFSAVIQRLIWPLLPQREICSLFAEMFRSFRELLQANDEAAVARHQERIALIPPELAAWIRVANTPEYPDGERQRLLALLRTVERLGYCILSTRKVEQLDAPPEVSERLRPHVAELEAQCQAVLTELEATFSRETATIPTSRLTTAFAPLEREIGNVRQSYLAGRLSFPGVLAYMGAMNFLEDAARLIDRCTEQVGDLRLAEYRGDYAL